MKYFVILLVMIGFVGTAFGQNIGDSPDKIWLPSCPIGSGPDCDKASLFPNSIAAPFFQSDSVAIGTIVQKEHMEQNSIRYSLNVDFYLKNYQPFDLLTATLSNAPEPQTFPDVLYYNSPVFNKDDLVFMYLEKNDGQYRVLPESFALDKHEVRGPPPNILLTKSPSNDIFEQGDKILVSGEVRKMELVKAVKEGEKLDAKLMLLESKDRNIMIFSDLMKIESDGSYNYVFDTSTIPPGRYELEINYGPSTTGDRITIEPNFKIWTPIKQYNFGISSEEIQCRENLVLVQKYDGTPACVKSISINTLIERGWADEQFRTLPIIDLHSPERISRETGYLGLMMLLPHIQENQTIAVSLEGRPNIVLQMTQHYKVDILSNKTSADGSFLSIYGKITKTSLQRFFEDEPLNFFAKHGVLLTSLGGYQDNTGTFGPFNQFLSENEAETIGDVLQYYEDRRTNQEEVEWSDFVEWPTGIINDEFVQILEKRKMQETCEKFSGSWNKDFATCFDFSDDYDCEEMGGELVGKAYTGIQPDYSKKSDSFVCEFKK